MNYNDQYFPEYRDISKSTAIVARDRNNVIAIDGKKKLPWDASKLEKDTVFLNLIMSKYNDINSVLVLGRKTFECMKKKFFCNENYKNLCNANILIITSNKNNIILEEDNLFVQNKKILLSETFNYWEYFEDYNNFKTNNDIKYLILGGSVIYNNTIKNVDTIFLTMIYDYPEMDSINNLNTIKPEVFRKSNLNKYFYMTDSGLKIDDSQVTGYVYQIIRWDKDPKILENYNIS